MPTPKQGYPSGWPSVTTITGRYDDKNGIIYRAREQGYLQAQRGELINHKEWQETAADAGTAAHAMIEARIKGNDTDAVLSGFPLEIHHPARVAFESYVTWAEKFEVQIIHQEIQLESSKYQYGGTLDAVGFVGGKLSLLDWKTSKALYDSYPRQMAAYENVWNENHPDNPLVGGTHLIMFSKSKSGKFSHHHFPELGPQWEWFKLAREMYRLEKEHDA